LAKALLKPPTVLPGRRRFGRLAAQNALPVSNRSTCESPQHQVMVSSVSTNGKRPFQLRKLVTSCSIRTAQTSRAQDLAIEQLPLSAAALHATHATHATQLDC
jgi:hypothetical protein